MKLKIKCGSRRVVVLVNKRWVIKVPKFWNWRSFIFGIVEQINERYWYCGQNNNASWNDTYYLAKIHWASRRGFIQVSKYYQPLDELPDKGESLRPLILKCLEWHKGFDHYCDLSHADGFDYNPSNLGYDPENNRVVAIDYGFFGLNNIDYGCPVYSRNNKPTLLGRINKVKWAVKNRYCDYKQKRNHNK